MLRKLCSLFIAVAFVVGVCGCAENEYKTTEKKEIKHESQPKDVKPGEMIVE